MEAAGILVRVAATWLAVDWISGIVHWCEDSYGRPSTPFIGRRITKPNLRHHFRPRAFLRNTWYASSELLLVSCLAVLCVAFALGRLSPMVVLAALLGANANQVHKWSHRTQAENGPLISAAQRLGLVQSPGHHQQHHSDRKDSRYCVLTDYLNPVLDGLRFWRTLETVLGVVGFKRRDDDAMLAALLVEESDFLRDAPGA